MPRLRNIILILLIAGALWHFYGEAFQRFGFQGAWEEIRADINAIKENPVVVGTIDTIKQELPIFINKLSENSRDNASGKPPEKPLLDPPRKQSFSINNIEIGDSRQEVEKTAGKPKRSTLNEYGVDWVAYHENYHQFTMVAYDRQNTVVGLYTNQDLLTSKQGISFASSKEEVLNVLDKPLKGIRKGFVNYHVENDGEFDTFLIDDNYVTIFYDRLDGNTVTAIQIIAKGLEEQKTGFFAKPSDDLKQGFEYQLFDLTNAARANLGLSILHWDENVRTTARSHSADMAENDYFSHTSLDGLSPFDRMTRDGIRYQLAGENLATGQTSSIFAHEGLMNSPGHRENILKNDYKELAVGVAFNDQSQPFYTENFLTK